jgi:hypothetical protein
LLLLLLHQSQGDLFRNNAAAPTTPFCSPVVPLGSFLALPNSSAHPYAQAEGLPIVPAAASSDIGAESRSVNALDPFLRVLCSPALDEIAGLVLEVPRCVVDEVERGLAGRKGEGRARRRECERRA